MLKRLTKQLDPPIFGVLMLIFVKVVKGVEKKRGGALKVVDQLFDRGLQNRNHCGIYSGVCSDI